MYHHPIHFAVNIVAASWGIPGSVLVHQDERTIRIGTVKLSVGLTVIQLNNVGGGG